MKLRLAQPADAARMMELVAQAKAFLRRSGVDQWQNGYPNDEVIADDIAERTAYVAAREDAVIGMVTVTFCGERTYARIRGAWLDDAPYATVHRIAVDDQYKGGGVAGFIMRCIESLCAKRGVHSIRTDTHEHNLVMNRLLRQQGYTRCGIVTLERDGAERVAYQKLTARP